jgi:hypothetical protein
VELGRSRVAPEFDSDQSQKPETLPATRVDLIASKHGNARNSMSIFLTALGVLLILLALEDVFQTLFQPAKRGDVSDAIARRIWRLFQAVMPRALSFAGPVAFVMVVFFWAASVVLGFALILFPLLPDAFTFVQGVNPATYRSFLGALDISLSSLMTVPIGAYSKPLLIQWMMGIESMLGFGLLTAAVSWLLSIYPVFEHRKSLAHEATLLHFAETEGVRRLEDISDSDLHQILQGFAAQLITCRNELSQFPITYYFHEEEIETSLAGVLPYLGDIAAQNVNRAGAAALSASVLGGAVDDYLRFIARSFLNRPFTNRDDILRAFATDHQRQVVRAPQRRQKAA